jgi:hypothetical protein
VDGPGRRSGRLTERKIEEGGAFGRSLANGVKAFDLDGLVFEEAMIVGPSPLELALRGSIWRLTGRGRWSRGSVGSLRSRATRIA